jgi:hypothetical protein
MLQRFGIEIVGCVRRSTTATPHHQARSQEQQAESDAPTSARWGRLGKEKVTMQLREMDEQVTYMQQLQDDDGPIVLINQFNVPSEETDRFVAVWAETPRT